MCDDGNLSDGDACPTTCQPAACGDGFVLLGFEGCDDGNLISGDGCSDLCVPDGCGSGSVDGVEECDEGGANGTPGSSCFVNCVSTDVAFDSVGDVRLDQSTRGNGPKAIATADMNGDGVLDLATGNALAGYASILYGFGGGRFWAPWFVNTGSNPQQLRLADVNGDTILDALTVNLNGNSISVALGNGQNFDSVTSYGITVGSGGDDPRGLAVADVDNDTDLDVVTANSNSDNVTILLNDGSGAFTATTLLTTIVAMGGDRPESVEIADVTGDGKVDIVTANAGSDDVTVLAGLGSGMFASASNYTTRAGRQWRQPNRSGADRCHWR